jgi:hypothetical protein
VSVEEGDEGDEGELLQRLEAAGIVFHVLMFQSSLAGMGDMGAARWCVADVV